MLTLSIIGCGRLGKTLAFLFVKSELVCIQDIVNLSIASSKKAITFIGQGNVCQTIKQLKPADVYLIATPDDSIECISQQLAEHDLLKQGNVVFHCSGLLSSECLNSVALLGCFTASLHPIFSFSDPMQDIKIFKGVHCAFEGNKKALKYLLPLFLAIEGEVFPIAKKDKPLYHAASVLASNYVVTLSTMAEACYKKAGLSHKQAKIFTQMLMIQALNKVQRLEPEAALTGPLQRADTNTLKKHLRVLKPFPELEFVYKSLGKATLALTRHNESLKKTLTQLFISNGENFF